MAKTVDPEMIARLREESERHHKDAPYPEGAQAKRTIGLRCARSDSPPRSTRASDAEFKHLPASTLVGSWILHRLEQESA